MVADRRQQGVRMRRCWSDQDDESRSGDEMP
jgi:hypothetical protein